MQISLNNQSEDFPTEGIDSFGQLMNTLSERAADQGDSVLEVKLNGEDITGKDKSHLEELPLGDIELLEVQTGDAKALARSTLYSVADFHQQLLQELQGTSELFRLGNMERSTQAFLKCIDGIQVFMHSLESCRRMLGISFELMHLPQAEGEDEQTVAESRRILFGMLDNILEVQTDQDWVLLADMLEYELIPALQDWREVIFCILEKTSSDQDAENMPDLQDNPEAIVS
ncbi:hypothetical protein CEE37_08060 [candidate division LCP-89 bacterium B3_LCP]|uniref:Uncharacterized protein n=1 Tax=candidate division LCP-89 bacterium B3_LCP TaxID=2012998 RepID=A0A532UZ89_UNCL8|nr:MAG: hypothetical protein CEE37_08060 [candidate division LCP-89 bacterium B3_LCP]